MKIHGGFGIEEECNENLLCIPFTEEQLAEIKKYAGISGMEVEEFIRSVLPDSLSPANGMPLWGKDRNA